MEDVLDAIRVQKRYQISFWDAMILASAVQLGCQVVWSEDLNPGQVYDQIVDKLAENPARHLEELMGLS